MTFLSQNGLRCIAYDRRGHGRSDHPGHGYDYDTLADDLAALISHLDLNSIMLVGHSMGAGEIARYLSRHGSSKVGRTVLVSPITPFMLRTIDNLGGLDPSIFDQVVGLIVADYPNALRQLASSFWGECGQVSRDMKEWVHQMGLQTSLIAASSCIRANWRTDFRADLAAFDIPTLVVQGDRDLILPLGQSGHQQLTLFHGHDC
jgi:non-heme chloroperoxidase